MWVNERMGGEQEKIPHRGRELLDVLARLGGSARNAQIAQVMDVSEETVRRLVKSLSKIGKVERVHGGTYLSRSQGSPMYSGALEQNTKEKTRIGRAVRNLVSDGMVVFLNVGSTTTHVAEQLRDLNGLTVVTNSISTVASLADQNGTRVHLAGGEVIRSERGSFGRATEEFACRFNYDAVICGADAISHKVGFLASNPAEADLTRVLADRTERMVIAADCRKFEARAPYVSCGFDKVTDLVTDARPVEALSAALKQANVTVHVAARQMSRTSETPVSERSLASGSTV